PPLPCCAVTDRGFTARGRRARPRRRRAPAAGGGSRRRRGVPVVAHLRHAAEDEATKAHRLLDLRMPANDVPYACGPNGAAGRRHRRLITLIFADRAELAVMVVIRRELPRTRVAGPARGLSRRSHEDPPSRVPPDRRPLCSSSVIVVVLGVRAALGGGGRTACRVLLDVHADGPDKPEELAGDRRDDLRGGFPLGEEARVAAVETMLRFPGERFDFLAQPRLTGAQRAADRQAMPIGPGGFDDDPAQVGVPGLGYAPAPAGGGGRA